MIFQTFALYPHLTIRQNLAYPLREAGVADGEIRRRVGEIAELLRIGHTLDRKPATASGGEQQRIAIGRALIRRPKLLLLDEPLTNLDAKLRHDTRAEFKRLHREFGMTMLYATPDELEALSMGQRIGVMRDGRMVQVGTPDELFERPGDRFVAEQVGSPQDQSDPGHQRRRRRRASGCRSPRWREAPGATALRRLSGRHAAAVRLPAARPAPGRGRCRTGRASRARVHLTEPLGDVTVLDLEAQGERAAHGAAGGAGAAATARATSSMSSWRSSKAICSPWTPARLFDSHREP